MNNQPTYRLVTYHDSTKPSEIIKIAPSDPRPIGFSSMTRGHPTEAELREKELIHDEPCRHCGMIFSTRFTNGDRLRENVTCHGCDFWMQRHGAKKAIIIDGHHFMDGGEKSGDNRFLGHAGRRFYIRMFSGEKFTTNNLWSQGLVPHHFRELFPDNAEFVKPPNKA